MKYTTLLLTAAATMACSKTPSVNDISAAYYPLASDQNLQSLSYDLNRHPANKVVCDAFGGGGVSHPSKGVKATLFYSGTGPRYYSANDYITKATQSAQHLFFTDLFVPTRIFSEGFSTQTSQFVKDDAGNKLIEFFGLQFDFNLRLLPEDAIGDYEFAVLGDDGIILKVGTGAQQHQLINIDGDHPTKMGCSNEAIAFDRTTRLTMQMLYYQGPRYHIADVLLWRPLHNNHCGSETLGHDSMCNQSGNNLYFNPDNHSEPLAAYEGLLQRGWKPVSADHFYVPDETQFNPCTAAVPPVISDFQLVSFSTHEADFSWTTDVPSTSQIILIKTSTGQEVVPATDNVLRTQHNVHISNLEVFTSYDAKAISLTEDFGKAVSSVINFKTPLE